MNRLILLLITISCISFISCDGRDKKHRTTQQDLIENKVLDTFSTAVSYFPETYVEVVTDTILNSGFQVKITTSTDMEDIILNEFIADSIKYKQYYRNYTGKVNILYNKSLVLDQKIDKSLFKEVSPDFNWEDAIMGQIILNQENTNKNQVQLDVFYCLIASQNCKDYKLIINTSGDLKIEDLNTPEIQ